MPRSPSSKRKADHLDSAPPDRFSLPRKQLVDVLFRLGWLVFSSLDEARKKATPEQIQAALLGFQAFHGLNPDGWAGPQTERAMGALRICSMPDVMAVGEGLAKWPSPDIRWWLDEASFRSVQISADLIGEAFAWAWSQWAAVCNVNPSRTANQNQAHVRIRFAPIDGASKTLAWSELANNTNTAKQQQYDSAETWVYSATPQRFQIDLGRVGCHEIGHVLGIGHIASGNLLQPTYDTNIRSPQAGDIREAQARYGPPKGNPPPPPPPAGETFTVTLTGTGKLAALAATGFKVERLP